MIGIAELSRPPRYCTIRPGKKTFLLADFVSRQRAVDRSPDQQVVRCEASIGIISNEVIDNTQAVGSTRGRPLWLRCHRLTAGARRCAARLSLAIYVAHHRFMLCVCDAFLSSLCIPVNITGGQNNYFRFRTRVIHTASGAKQRCKKGLIEWWTGHLVPVYSKLTQ